MPQTIWDILSKILDQQDSHTNSAYPWMTEGQLS